MHTLRIKEQLYTGTVQEYETSFKLLLVNVVQETPKTYSLLVLPILTPRCGGYILIEKITYTSDKWPSGS